MPAGTIRDGKHKDMTSGASTSGSSGGVVVRGDARGAVIREPSVVVIRGIAELEAENQELRRQLALHEKHASSHPPPAGPPSARATMPFWVLFAVAFTSAVLTTLLLRYIVAR